MTYRINNKGTALILLIIMNVVLSIAMFAECFLIYKRFSPKIENARREIFENTRSYNQAKLQELAKYKHEYMQADYSDKEAISFTIRHKFADYRGELPNELNNFLTEIRGY